MTSTTFLSTVLVVLYAIALPQSPTVDCKDWKACRELALEAASKQDYDAFHDLAWRTVNAGPKNDPALMTMLARAQSLSGRPHDALVMLNRLAAMGVVTDAPTNDDFARVRALPGWAELAEKIAGVNAPTPASTPAPAPAPPKPAAREDARTKKAPVVNERPAEKKPEPPPAALKETPLAPRKESPPPPPPKESPRPALAFSSSGMTTTGLAYDAVSGRFIVADGRDRRLLVLGERSGRLASLAGIDAGLGEITAIEIDSREGDLWVVSTLPASRESTLHKLQLISGRVLLSMPLPAEHGASRFADVAVTPQHVLVLDNDGRRLFRAAKKGKSLDVAVRLAAPEVVSIAPASDSTVYAAYDRGLLRIDLTSRTSSVVDSGPKVDLSGVTWMRWHRGGIVAVQKNESGAYRLVRIRLDDSGRTARAVDSVDEAAVPASPTAVTIANNTLYCLVTAADKDEVVVKKVPLK